jgi:hypothetical protein
MPHDSIKPCPSGMALAGKQSIRFRSKLRLLIPD